MDIGIKFLPTEATKWDVTRAIAEVLHSPDFMPTSDGRLINFDVLLNMWEGGGIRNNGTGRLTLPTPKIGGRFLTWVEDRPIRIMKKKVKFFKYHNTPPENVVSRLVKTIYVSPDVEEEHEKILWGLQERLRVNVTQIGVFYRDYNGSGPQTTRAFSVEWETQKVGWLTFHYVPKLMRITLGEPLKEEIGSIISIPFSNIQRIAAGYDGMPYLCFDLLTPPSFEQIEFHAPITGDKKQDNKRWRVTSIDEGHKSIAPFAHQMRFLFYNDTTDVISTFRRMCDTAGLARNLIVEFKYPYKLEATKRGFFTSRRLHDLLRKTEKFPWAIAFQLRALLHNNLLHTEDLFALLPHVEQFYKVHSGPNKDGVRTGDLLRHFSEALRVKNVNESPMGCFERVRTKFEPKKFPPGVEFQLKALLRGQHLRPEHYFDLLPLVANIHEAHPGLNHDGKYVSKLLQVFRRDLLQKPSDETPIKCFQRVSRGFENNEAESAPQVFLCYHVSFTPTHTLLEGPYATQSNRVIRKYKGHEQEFLRVDFRDEDRTSYGFDRDVDPWEVLHERVELLLKEGFSLAGRHFEFLAYSTSALREHAVWFMHRFRYSDPEKPGSPERWLTAEEVRQDLGDFEGTELLKQPSKLAARIAQAFTATESSVLVFKHEWEEVDDLGPEQYPHTDGVGTISRSLANRIWKALCDKRKDHRQYTVEPSAYQMRFLGFKGVVAVDEQLDNHPKGIQMRLRGSMRKFTKAAESAFLEIAEAFQYPKSLYLNRPLVMFLEDLGVRQDTFMRLKDEAVAKVVTIEDSIDKFRKVLKDHSFGGSYGVQSILDRLSKEGFSLQTSRDSPGIDTPFLKQLRQVAKTDILRDIKHHARIYMPESYLLVGIADEGPAYQEAGVENVYNLPEGHIYVCIHHEGEEPFYLQGSCMITRSPVTHPGDIQRVRAIGKPPSDKLCLFSHIKNVVVLPSVGKRSLASMLSGGDLDGDEFAVVYHPALLPTYSEEPASYTVAEGSLDTWTLKDHCTINDICDFVVEYIHSDVLGLLSTRQLVIADQSSDGVNDKDCLYLSELCSQAVDYPKKGIPVDLDSNPLPRKLIKYNPDWQKAEIVSPHDPDFYESTRALGVLFRSIVLEEPESIESSAHDRVSFTPLSDPISIAYKQRVLSHLGPSAELSDETPALMKLFLSYTDELAYICSIHTVTNTPGAHLLEAEVVIGVILAKCRQKRMRSDRMYRMRLHTSELAKDVQQQLFSRSGLQNTRDELLLGLERAWQAWELSQSRHAEFGAGSFGLIALRVVFDCLDDLATLN
ncbi:RNA dependent RNA polymerase-domain-containing protein [Crucibulum laeve]|uniref:RNA-dependent RNA polymerase n=1 Tax=Crucibulum laeve TaxID=68775 RepID=A0A5C3LRD0_9AGAR|nr:RNA dependent RNA polymerase-domain-containing protein [Crucibulum laeve]